MRVVKTIVPGLESETMSYHRIGWRGVRRLRERDDPLMLNAARDGCAARPAAARGRGARGRPGLVRRGARRPIVGSLYPLYREPGPFAAQLRMAMRKVAP